MIRVYLTGSADRDIDQAVLWYDRQRPGLGKFFLVELNQAFERIAIFPEGYHPAVRPGVRRMLLSRFPYAVTYCSKLDRIVVIAVLHQSGHEDRTLRRIESP